MISSPGRCCPGAGDGSRRAQVLKPFLLPSTAITLPSGVGLPTPNQQVCLYCSVSLLTFFFLWNSKDKYRMLQKVRAESYGEAVANEQN